MILETNEPTIVSLNHLQQTRLVPRASPEGTDGPQSGQLAVPPLSLLQESPYPPSYQRQMSNGIPQKEEPESDMEFLSVNKC